jgi:hypothetical protein
LASLLLASTLAISQSIVQQPIALSGTVTDPSSAQIPQAKVRLLSLDRVLETAADNQGHFLLPSVPQGVYDLEVSAPGFLKQGLHLDLTKVHDRPLDITLGAAPQPDRCGPVPSVSYLPAKPGEPRLTATISDYEKPHQPVSGGKAYLSADGGKTSVLSSRADHNGAFQFDQLPAAEYNLRVTGPGHFDETLKLLVPHENNVRVEFSLLKHGHLLACQ